jgi:nicotianamine synthase
MTPNTTPAPVQVDVDDPMLDVTTRVTVEQVIDIHARLAALPSLAPSAEADAVLAELIAMTTSSSSDDSDELFADPRVRAILPELRRYSAAGEYQRELFWSRAIVSSRDPVSSFRDVPYHDNYRRLLAFEVGGVVAAVNPHPRRVLMIGSGPMPVTLIHLAEMLETDVVGIDVNAEACDEGRALCRALGVQAPIHQCDVLDFEDFGDFDFVLLAASVGLERDARLKILARLAGTMSPDAALVVRTAHGTRRLMFPQIDPEDLDGFECQYLVQPVDRDHDINSMLIARKT